MEVLKEFYRQEIILEVGERMVLSGVFHNNTDIPPCTAHMSWAFPVRRGVGTTPKGF